jgi:hypothetical protein
MAKELSDKQKVDIEAVMLAYLSCDDEVKQSVRRRLEISQEAKVLVLLENLYNEIERNLSDSNIVNSEAFIEASLFFRKE